MTAWTPEPWSVAPSGAILDPMGFRIEDVCSKANQARIVACVNACAGISDPAAVIKAARDVVARYESDDKYFSQAVHALEAALDSH